MTLESKRIPSIQLTISLTTDEALLLREILYNGSTTHTGDFAQTEAHREGAHIADRLITAIDLVA